MNAYSARAMPKLYGLVLALLFLGSTLARAEAPTPTPGRADTVVIRSGSVGLHALLFRPQGSGPFPAILLNHGSGRTTEDLRRLGPYEGNAAKLGPLFVRHGYVLLYLFRRGVGPSTDQCANAVDLMNRESATHGQEARNALQLELLEGREMTDALAALKFLRGLPEVMRAMSARSVTRLEARSLSSWRSTSLNCARSCSSPPPVIALTALRNCAGGFCRAPQNRSAGILHSRGK